MEEVTLGLAILLGAGFLVAKLGQLIRLPSVTGYICAGILLGPSGLNIITTEAIGARLSHFTQIALMLIAFGIGEHIEIKKIKKTLGQVGLISLAEIGSAFLLVSLGIYLLVQNIGIGGQPWETPAVLGLAIILGAIAIATAPATILHVVREAKASGPLTTTLMQVVAINNGLAIMTFGVATTITHRLLGFCTASLMQTTAASLREVLFSLGLGIVTGLAIDFINSRLRNRDEMLTAGLALLLLCGEGARFLGLSPLLAGMAAGFTIVNRDTRDVRFFRALNAFEAPIYVLFFTLAGAHLDTAALPLIGWVGLTYFSLRVVGKICGTKLAALITKAPTNLRRYLGLALLPQAGVAIGLILLVQSDAALQDLAVVITPVVLASVMMAELLGPICVRFALDKSGEAHNAPLAEAHPPNGNGGLPPTDGLQLIPWSWEKLHPPPTPNGVVIFGASNIATVAGLARIATLFAHHHEALPMAVRVLPPDKPISADQNAILFAIEKNETATLGYGLKTMMIQADDVASGLISAAMTQKTWGIFLGHPLRGTAQEFERVVERVTKDAPCPVIVVRFAGVLHTEKILVPVVSRRDLTTARSIIRSLCSVGQHKVTIMYLIPSEAAAEEAALATKKLHAWARLEGLDSIIDCQVRTTETRLETIVAAAADHDLLVMVAGQTHKLQRLFFGSLAESVARQCRKPMLMVHDPRA